MQTSYFARLKKGLPPGLRPVSIARFNPPWFDGEQYAPLTPAACMLRIPDEAFVKYFEGVLAGLDAAKVVEELRDRVLICYEKPDPDDWYWCHRRLVARWIEAETGLIVPELQWAEQRSLFD